MNTKCFYTQTALRLRRYDRLPTLGFTALCAFPNSFLFHAFFSGKYLISPVSWQDDLSRWLTGNSLFFSRLKGKKLFGAIEISEHLIWTVFDPILVIVLAYFLDMQFDLWALALALKVGAVCLAIQEFQIWNRNKDMIRNMIDQEIDSALLLAEREKYKEISTPETQGILAEKKAKAIVS